MVLRRGRFRSADRGLVAPSEDPDAFRVPPPSTADGEAEVDELPPPPLPLPPPPPPAVDPPSPDGDDDPGPATPADVHIEPMGERVRIRNRIEGALHEVMSLPRAMAQALASWIKIMPDLNIVEGRRPQAVPPTRRASTGAGCLGLVLVRFDFSPDWND